MPRTRFARRFVAGSSLAALGLCALVARGADEAAAPDRLIHYENDALTVRLVRVPVTDVLDELGRQSGASVRGPLVDQREVSAEFKAVPLPQALARLLGDQNFSLVYGEGGRLRVVSLLPGAPGAGNAMGMATTTSTLVKGGDMITLEEFAELIDRQPPIPLDGPLGEALGSTATYRQLFDASLSHADASIRMTAIGVAVRSIEGKPELRAKLIGAASGVDAENLSQLIESAAGNRAQEFASNVTAQTRATEVRAKFSTALHHLRRRGAGAGG